MSTFATTTDVGGSKEIQKIFLNLIAGQIARKAQTKSRNAVKRREYDTKPYQMAAEFVGNFLFENGMTKTLNTARNETNGMITTVGLPHNIAPEFKLRPERSFFKQLVQSTRPNLRPPKGAGEPERPRMSHRHEDRHGGTRLEGPGGTGRIKKTERGLRVRDAPEMRRRHHREPEPSEYTATETRHHNHRQHHHHNIEPRKHHTSRHHEHHHRPPPTEDSVYTYIKVRRSDVRRDRHRRPPPTESTYTYQTETTSMYAPVKARAVPQQQKRLNDPPKKLTFKERVARLMMKSNLVLEQNAGVELDIPEEMGSQPAYMQPMMAPAFPQAIPPNNAAPSSFVEDEEEDYEEEEDEGESGSYTASAMSSSKTGSTTRSYSTSATETPSSSTKKSSTKASTTKTSTTATSTTTTTTSSESASDPEAEEDEEEDEEEDGKDKEEEEEEDKDEEEDEEEEDGGEEDFGEEEA